MMSLLTNYIVESTISLTVFYIFYEVFLKRDTWFRLNRYFLLFGLIFSIALPLLSFSSADLIVRSPNQFEFTEIARIGKSVSSFEESSLSQIPKINYLAWLYLVIASLFFVRLIYQLIKIVKTINAYEIIKIKKYKIVLITKDSAPFSFFHYIFISKEDYNADDYHGGVDDMLMHEIVHAQQKHSLDVILLELLLVLQWFNPFIYRYRLAFKEIHEYLADRGVLEINNDKIAYQKLILCQLEENFKVNLTSQFNYSLIKNRIKMMTRINSSKSARFKMLLVLPFILVLLSAFTMETTRDHFSDKTSFSIGVSEQASKIPSIFPVKKVDGVELSSSFGMRMHPIKKKKMMHKAVDIKAPEGTPVFATADGLIRKVKKNFEEGKGYGRYIIIDHEGGFSTLYAQLSAYQIKEGVEVKKGDVIGYVGSSGMSTGPHLHYEVMKDGENVNPEDYF